VEAFEEDRARDAALTATGLRPLRFTWRRLTEEPEDVLAELKATLSGRM
jgi:very-short-patch-repair endonuclease